MADVDTYTYPDPRAAAQPPGKRAPGKPFLLPVAAVLRLTPAALVREPSLEVVSHLLLSLRDARHERSTPSACVALLVF